MHHLSSRYRRQTLSIAFVYQPAMRSVLALGALAAIALTPGAVARAADARPAQIARALAAGHVYVSDSIARVASPAQVRALRAEVARDPFAVYAAIVPFFDAESAMQT